MATGCVAIKIIVSGSPEVHVAADGDVKLVLRQAGLYKIPLREEKEDTV